jgi:hypothetical protein
LITSRGILFADFTMDAAGKTFREVPATISMSTPAGLPKSASVAVENSSGKLPPKSTVAGLTAMALHPAHTIGVLLGGPSAGS